MADELKQVKQEHVQNLMTALDLNSGQTFSKASLKRYELLQAISSGEKIRDLWCPDAKDLLAKRGKVQAFLGINKNRDLAFTLSTTKQALVQIEPLIKAKKPFSC